TVLGHSRDAPHVGVFLTHTNHDTLVSRSSDNGAAWMSVIRDGLVCSQWEATHGKTARGASSPAHPALHMPEPLSI
ncbi:unnamed protein product, partial [Mycena citricolor]